MNLSGYVFEALRKDEEFILYRGQSKDIGSQVLVLSPAVQRSTPESLKRLEHEYSLKQELDPSWATRPIAIARHWDRTVLVSADPGGVPLDQLLGQPVDVAFSLRLAISLSTAIGHLHQRGVIHKDIKPANVLANAVTGQCWLMGFGIASRLPRERQSPEPPEFVAGTLAYMAPEQTGRMNRSIDSRSDLYALGVTLYEVLTGSLPFTASDPMEWVHCHIARQPIPPKERLKSLPPSVSAIIMKLLAKTAEERYQTAAGLESDLRRCLVEWESQQEIVEFPLGEHDTPDRLRIPEKLYGRAHEIDTLLASFDRVVANGRPELILVSGYSGIGKSSVVNELHKVLVPPRGLFAGNLQGEILEANEAFLQIVQYSREDLASRRVRWTDLTPAEWRESDEWSMADLRAIGVAKPFHKEYFRKDGSRVPVLVGAAIFKGSGSEGVAFVLDLSEQKRAEDALQQAQAELARVSRITTMEQLAASIAHEVNQPLGAVVTSGNACLNWLSTSPPNLRKARQAVERIVRDGNRASDVLKRVRALLKKAPFIKSSLNVNEVIQEVLALVGGELRKRGVEVSTELDFKLPSVMADFVQLQQVLLNLVMNAIESMTTITDRPRVLQILSSLHDLAGRPAVRVVVRDSGVGLTADGMAGVFEAFYSTKPEGMGMGLWICRSIIEAHGGQLTAQPNESVGATFQFVLPASAEDNA